MGSRLNSLIAVLTALLCGVLGLPTAQAAECTLPDGDRIIKALKLDVPYLSVERLALTEYHGETLQWVSASWSGPIGGELVVMDCKGRVLAGVEAGSVASGKAVSIAGYPYPVLRTNAQTMSGTDQAHAYTESLFAFNGKRIINLWEHETEVYGFQLCEESPVDTWQIVMRPDLHEIKVSGTRHITRGTLTHSGCANQKVKTKPLQRELYCWNGKRYAKSRSSCTRPARNGR